VQVRATPNPTSTPTTPAPSSDSGSSYPDGSSYSSESSYSSDTPTPAPTDAPTPDPTDAPTPAPTDAPTATGNDTGNDTGDATDAPTPAPTTECSTFDSQDSATICYGANLVPTKHTCGDMCQTWFTKVTETCDKEGNTRTNFKKELITACTEEKQLPAFNLDSATIELVAALGVDTIDFTAAIPTPAPAPEYAGFEYVTTKRKVKVVQVALAFALTKEEANFPLTRQALIDGFSISLGISNTRATVSKIGNEAVTKRRRLSGIDIEFSVATLKGDDGKKLEENIKTAAKSGAVVTAIKKEASAKGVLVASLKNMDPVINDVKTSVAEIEVEETILVKTTAAPPTPAPALIAPDSAATSLCPAFVSMLVIFVVSMMSVF